MICRYVLENSRGARILVDRYARFKSLALTNFPGAFYSLVEPRR